MQTRTVRLLLCSRKKRSEGGIRRTRGRREETRGREGEEREWEDGKEKRGKGRTRGKREGTGGREGEESEQDIRLRDSNLVMKISGASRQRRLYYKLYSMATFLEKPTVDLIVFDRQPPYCPGICADIYPVTMRSNSRSTLCEVDSASFIRQRKVAVFSRMR